MLCAYLGVTEWNLKKAAHAFMRAIIIIMHVYNQELLQ